MNSIGGYMGIKEKDKSLLEVAIELLEVKKKPQKMLTIVKEVMELKGIKSSAVKELAPQFILDFMQSGYFVYCGDDTWDLKDRQPTSVLDKEGGDYEDIYEDDEDVKNNELKDEIFDEESSKNIIRDDNDDTDDDDDDEDENEDEDEDDDLAKAFETFDEEFGGGMVVVDDEDSDEDENK